MKTNLQPFFVSPGNYLDPRGLMGILEDQQVPFQVKRIFWISQVPDNTQRGGHAHRTSEQLLICISGAIEVELEGLNGQMQKFQLDQGAHQGLYLPPLCWGYFRFKQQAVALCLASDHFSESDYIRDYQEFKKMKDAHQH